MLSSALLETDYSVEPNEALNAASPYASATKNKPDPHSYRKRTPIYHITQTLI